MDTLYTFWGNITHYKTGSVYFLGLMNSATKRLPWETYRADARDARGFDG